MSDAPGANGALGADALHISEGYSIPGAELEWDACWRARGFRVVS